MCKLYKQISSIEVNSIQKQTNLSAISEKEVEYIKSTNITIKDIDFNIIRYKINCLHDDYNGCIIKYADEYWTFSHESSYGFQYYLLDTLEGLQQVLIDKILE